MAISFDEWRAAKQQGKQATDKPDFAAWRLKKQQEEEDAKKLSVTGTASGSVGIPESVGAPLPSVKNRFATPDTIKLGDTQVPATGMLGAIADVATGISNLGESVPASYREGARTSKASVAKQELDFTGRVTLEPERPAKYERGGILVSPATPGKFLTGKEAEDYVASLEAPTADTRTMEEYRQEAGIFGRAATSTLSQPEQALSVLGGMAGAAVGMPGVGAALGSAPAIISAYNAEYLRNRQLGLGPEESRANALAKLPVEALTEFVGGRFGAKSLPAGVVLGGAEEGAAELGGMGVDLASQQLSTQPEAYEQKLPKTFAEGLTQVTESALGGMMGAGIMAGAPRALGAGMSAAREMLAKAGGISDGRPDVKDTRSSIKIDPKINEGLDLAQPKVSTSYVDAPINIAPSNIDTVEAPVTTGINIEGAKRDSVNPDGDSKKREIPAKEDTLSTAPLSAVQLTTPEVVPAELPAATTQNQSQALPATPVAPTVSEAPVASQEAGTSVPASTSAVAPAPAGQAAREVQTPVTPTQVPQVSNTKPKRTKTPAPKPISDKDALAQAFTELQQKSVSDPAFQKQITDNPSLMRQMATKRAAEIVAASKAPRAPAAPVTDDAPRFILESSASAFSERAMKEAKSEAGYGSRKIIAWMTPEQFLNLADEGFDESKASTVKRVMESGEGFLSIPQLRIDASGRVVSHEGRHRSRALPPNTKMPVLLTSDSIRWSKQNKPDGFDYESVWPASIRAQSKAKNPNYSIPMPTREAIVASPYETDLTGAAMAPALDMATLTPNKPRYESKDAFLTELYSGVGDKEATEARKIADNIVVYDGDADLAGIDPEVATKVQEAVQKQGATGARPKAFQYKGKVYFNMEGVRPGEAKSTFLHEARVHLAAKAEPARVSALASRVVALAKAGDATAQAAAKTVAKEYPGVTQSAKEGNESAKDLSREELLADFAQRVYDRVKSGQGVSGTIKRLYSDVMSYLRDLYTTAAKKLFGERFALNITDVDILDAVRYGRTAAGFKGEAKPTALAEAAQKAKDETPAMALTSDTIKPDTGGVELPQGTVEQRIGERIQSWTAPVVSPKGTGSTSAKLMGEKAIGISNEQRLAAEVLAVDLKKQMAKELAKGMKKLPEHARARYAFRVGQALAGDVTILDELPKDVRNTVKAMRRMLDDGMLRIIALGAVPASKIRTLLSGEGKWIHRDFDVFHHDPSEYRKKLQAMARAGEDVISPLLPDIEKDLQLPDADVLQTIADMLGTKGGKKDWRKESMEKLRKVTGEPTPKRGATPKTNKAVRDAAEEYLRDMAAKWGIGRNTKMDGKDGIVSRLIELSKNGDIRAAASRYANSLLDPKAGYNDDAPYIPSVMGIDDSSLDKRRKKVPEWMQTLWGRFQDPVAMFLTSVDNHANVIAKFTALAEYKARGMANGTVLENKEGMTDYNMFPKGFVLLQKENDPLYYGPLNGMWVKQKDMDYLGVTASQRMAEKMLSQGIGPKLFRPYSLLMQPAKMMQIAANHSSFIINAASSVFMLSRANPFTTLPRGLKAARYTALGGTRFGKAVNDKTLSDDVNAMIRQGLLVNNALAGEARRKLRELIMEPGERFLPTPVKLMNKLKRAGGKVSDSLSRALSFFDEAGKVMMVYARMKDLEAIYPDKSRDEIREIAIEHAMQTMPVASREAPISRMMGNSGVVNVYAPFYAAMVRNTYNHLKLADEYSKMESPAAKRYAFAEMALLSLKAFGVYALTKSAIEMFGHMYSGNDDDDEDEREKAAKAQQEHYDELRAMHPEYQQGDVLYTRESEPDVFHFLSAQRYDPLPFGALAAASARGDENEKMNLLVSYLFSDSPILEPLSNVIGYGVQTAAGEVTEPDSFSMSAKERFMKGAEGLLKAALPGAWKDFEKQYKSDDEASPFEMFAHNVGFTHGVLDLRKETGNAAAGYLAILNSLKKDAGKRVSTEDGVFFDAKADFVGDVTARAEAWRIARRKISAMQKYGKSDEWIEEAIASNPYTSSMSKDEVESLLDGVFRVPDYQEWLDKQYEMDITDPKNARRLDEVEEQYARYGKELQQFEEGLADLLKGMEVEYY